MKSRALQVISCGILSSGRCLGIVRSSLEKATRVFATILFACQLSSRGKYSAPNIAISLSSMNVTLFYTNMPKDEDKCYTILVTRYYEFLQTGLLRNMTKHFVLIADLHYDKNNCQGLDSTDNNRFLNTFFAIPGWKLL